MLRNLILTFCFVGMSPAFAQTPVVQSVLSAADYSPLIAPGVWVAIFGDNLAPAAIVDTTLPLPLQLGGVTVTLGGVQIPLRYVSPGQINALIPFTQGLGYALFVVATPTGTSAPYEARFSNVAPAIYTQNSQGTGPALAFDAGFQPIARLSTSPIVLYASGLGPTNPPGTSAGGNTSEPLNRVVVTPIVQIGGQLAEVLFAGLAPGLPGIYQLDVVPPAGPVADNTLTVGFSYFPPKTVVDGAFTTLPTPAGMNVANLTGSITPTYPLSTTTLDYSALLLAAQFNVAFDILPGAKPFTITAACQAGGMSISLNPSAGTWQATSEVPTSAEKSGDFDNATDGNGVSLAPVTDFLAYNTPFLAGVPPSRLDPVAVQAAAAIALPNYIGVIPNVNFIAQGTIPGNGRFVIDGSTNSALSNFGGFLKAPVPLSNGEWWRSTPCSLIVDGLLTASSLTTFQ